MIKFIHARFILLTLLLFFGNLNLISASAYSCSLLNDTDTTVADTAESGLADTVITAENTGAALIGENAQIIPRTQTFSFDIVRILRGILGMIVLVALAYLFSTNRKAISWQVVYVGLAIQLVLAICILWIPGFQTVFEFVGKVFVKIIDFTLEGTKYLFKSIETGKIEPPLLNFVITILPTIIFFSAITSILYYLRVIQVVVFGLAWLLSKALKITGAEGLSVAGNIFLGQTESPLMIKGYLDKMNKSQMLLVMSGGMATLAGGVLAVYINVLGGTDPIQKLIFAKHLLAASVMAAPGVIVISKILILQTEKVNTDVEVPKEKIGKNLLDAITIGTSDGLRLAVNVAAMLLVFIALIAMINFIFLKIGNWTNLNPLIGEITSGRYEELSLQFILGYSLSPLMWLIGVCSEDMTLVGQLLGEKIILTEFISYISLADMKTAGAFTETKSIIMSTYILCGFANFASIGIQIGGIGALAPSQRILLSRLGLRALLAGTLASLLSATIIGMILG
ncbi:MAG: Na+ dependent nucleoside transporter [Deltaproteobacteria bacterium]|nr:Na+ dependent nucleoside transporter [Deltaproteobacteria bacterium]